MNEIRWTIRVDEINTEAPKTHWHWAVTRNTDNSKYQKDGDGVSQWSALAAAVSEISDFEKLGE